MPFHYPSNPPNDSRTANRGTKDKPMLVREAGNSGPVVEKTWTDENGRQQSSFIIRDERGRKIGET